VRVTASIGVATFSPEDNNLEAVIERADCAMFASKNQGRNRVSLGKTDENLLLILVFAWV
jgi:diguanylate cyclase (GGDEF)-like protein